MSLTFCPLYSGSSGNAIFISNNQTNLLIDAGLSGKTIINALCAIGVDPGTLSAILITHEHSDHIKGAGILSRKFNIPIYATERTWHRMGSIGEVRACNQRIFYKSQDFYINNIDITPFAIPHDAADPVGFRLYHKGYSVATATDLGHFHKSILDNLAGCDIVLLESNHDPEMLSQNPRYSMALKKRILSNHGHLSNQDSSKAVISLINTGVKHIVLGHLSGENNLPELAYGTTEQALLQNHIKPGKDIGLDVALRDQIGKVYQIQDQIQEKIQSRVQFSFY